MQVTCNTATLELAWPNVVIFACTSAAVQPLPVAKSPSNFRRFISICKLPIIKITLSSPCLLTRTTGLILQQHKVVDQQLKKTLAGYSNDAWQASPYPLHDRPYKSYAHILGAGVAMLFGKGSNWPIRRLRDIVINSKWHHHVREYGGAT